MASAPLVIPAERDAFTALTDQAEAVHTLLLVATNAAKDLDVMAEYFGTPAIMRQLLLQRAYELREALAAFDRPGVR